MENQFWSTKQVARYLGFSARTIRRKAQAGEIPAIRIFGEWRFRVEAIKELAMDRQVGQDRPVLYVSAFPKRRTHDT